MTNEEISKKAAEKIVYIGSTYLISMDLLMEIFDLGKDFGINLAFDFSKSILNQKQILSEDGTHFNLESEVKNADSNG